tara:strand:+ start:785 stop:1270 length:486 start_codon:yes stop_codon:yes gene_type:complete
MHTEAFEFVAVNATTDRVSVIEIGSRDVNGTARVLFSHATWLGLDLHEGPAVDVVCNAAEYVTDDRYDITICLEVLEHSEHWPELVRRLHDWLKPGGRTIITCAGVGREPHSAIDGQAVREGEYYGNIDTTSLQQAMEQAGFVDVKTEQRGPDTYATGSKE